jgi:hypothetical protein
VASPWSVMDSSGVHPPSASPVHDSAARTERVSSETLGSYQYQPLEAWNPLAPHGVP